MPEDTADETDAKTLISFKDGLMDRIVLNGFDDKCCRSEEPCGVLEFPWEFPFDRREFLFLLGHELHSLGLKQTASMLEEESSVRIRNEEAEQFRLCISEGAWEAAFGFLPSLIPREPEENFKKALLMVYTEMYLELLEAGRLFEAVVLLRDEIGLLSDDHRVIQDLSSYLLFGGHELKESGWLGPEFGRLKLLKEIQSLCDPTILPPDHQISNLLKEALEHRFNSGQKLHESFNGRRHSLIPPRSDEEAKTCFFLHQQIKTDHPVWHVAFSPHGTTYAFGLENGHVHIGQTFDSRGNELILKEHQNAITKLAFNSDGSYLLSTSLDCKAIIWNVATGEVVQTLKNHKWPILAGAWLGSSVVTASEDGKILITSLEPVLVEGQVIRTRANDITSFNDRLLYAATNSSVSAYKMAYNSLELRWTTPFDQKVTSIYVSDDGQLLAADTVESTSILKAYDGALVSRIMVKQTARNHVSRSCLAGNFILRGSIQPNSDPSSANTSVWNRHTGSWLHDLNPPTGHINMAAWNQRHNVLAVAHEIGGLGFWTPHDDS